ncbi:class I adenylate-forming enzyme family protein [Flavisphingomonas formosensis]|uniref:class I adenylate-forming enzyme family protein n=1 Tax=Flavisphingomonas formosensis TaxID=861534 RepID=UPI0012F75792|nr:AMP-binding protein [Sphingomonas formosensis]
MRLKDYDLDVTTVKGIIARQAALGEKVAIRFEDQAITYVEVNGTANRIANSLKALGIGKGDVVVTYMQNSIDHILAWFGCAKLGAIWAPVNVALMPVDLAHTLRECRPAAIIMDDLLAVNYRSIREELGFKLHEIVRGAADPAPFADFTRLLDGEDVEPEVDIHWSDPAGIIFTGGSTGLPKGVLVSNAWYLPGLYRYHELFQPKAEDTHVSVGQLYHTIGSAVDVLAPIYWGMTTIIMRWYSTDAMLDAITRQGANFTVMVGPIMMALMAQAKPEDAAASTLKIVATATTGLPHEKLLAFREKFHVDTLEIYGQTETGPLGSVNQRLWDRPYHSVGKGHGWVDVAIGDPHGSMVAAGVTGEILIRNIYPSTFMMGYYNRPDKFAEACRDLWFHTGDLGYLDEQGYLHFVGRMAHSIRVKGENIAAVEIEEIIMTHPAVERAAVVGAHDARSGDEEIQAFVKLVGGAELEPLDIIKHCEGKIAYFKVPRFVEFVEALPVSATKNEVERHKLKEIGTQASFDRVAIGYKVRRSA